MAIGRKGDRPDLWEWGKNRNLLSELERSLEQYDTIFLVLDEQKEFSYLWEQYHKAGKHKEGKKDIMCMVKEGTDRKEGPIYHRISRQEAEKLEDLYYTYEFSDKFRILSEPGNFATIFNLANACSSVSPPGPMKPWCGSCARWGIRGAWKNWLIITRLPSIP